jgi:hypothetical protein
MQPVSQTLINTVRSPVEPVFALLTPHTFGWVERGERRGWKTLFRLDAAGGSTAITIRSVWVPLSVGAWVRGRFLQKRKVQGQLNAILHNLQIALTR